jgi:enoyl-CoA hydratase/carnithine racemase
MIRWQLADRIAVLTLDRGSARNAIPIAGWEALAAAASEIARSDPSAVILTSALSGAFSAGADLAEFRSLVADPALRIRFREAMAAGIEAVAALPMPVIAAIDGGCFGAAVALTLACDIVVAGDNAVFATTPAKLGLSYPATDVARLKARVGESAAALMLFTGDRIDADAAFASGLAHVRAAHAVPRAHELANAISANVPQAVTKLKRVLRDPAAPGHDAAFDDAFGSVAFGERLNAFLSGKR